MPKSPYSPDFDLSEGILAVNRDALSAARPWAWRRILDGLPPAPRPVAVSRPGRPFNLLLERNGRRTLLHSEIDPVGEAADLVARARTRRRGAIVVLGFGAGYLVEQALRVAPTGCVVTAAVVDPGSFLVTLAHRDLAALIGDGRMILAVGDARELAASMPASTGSIHLVHPPCLAASGPDFASLLERVRREAKWLAQGTARSAAHRRPRT